MSKILIIEDEAAIRRVLTKILSEENDTYQVEEAEDGVVGFEKIKNNDYDLVLCDIKMPKMDGVEVLEAVKKIKPEIPMVMISGHGDMETAINTMRLGAFDYISKPPDLNRLLNTVRNALDKKQLVVENKILKKKVSKNYEMIGESDAINHIKLMIDKVAQTEARVLITGPNGTGKELVAHQLHEKSERANFPLIEVNCAAIPSELIESELFGHVKGAFTSAVKDRAGKFEAADGGTLFLDEIGDMPLQLQSKLLRALEDREFRRVGGVKSIQIKTRIIAATNQDLEKQIKEGKFREDLYYRLNVIPIDLPPLRERGDDIKQLVNFFLERSMKNHKKRVTITDEAMDALCSYPWPGNVRELENTIERIVLMGNEDGINKYDMLLLLPALNDQKLKSEYKPITKKNLNLEELEKDAIIEALENNDFNHSSAALELGITLRQIGYKIKKYEI